MRGTHNHELLTYNEGHPYNSRLTKEEKEVVNRMTKNLIAPRLILNEVKAMRPNENHTTLKQIYNFRSKQRTSLREGRTEIQQLMNLLERDKFVYWHRAAPETNIVKDIFWAHPDSIELLNTFPIVLCIDSTYKTNRYKFPLVEIVGVTSTEKTFSVAFAYVTGEKMDNFAWALEKLRSLFRREDELPKVILTDRDIGMMNALAVVFPTSTNLLCQFHIKKNVRAKAKMLVQPMPFVEDIMNAFQRVVHAKTTDEYEMELQNFTSLSEPFPNFLHYVNTTWLDPYKDRFIDAWINRYMHLGNTTTNRVESAHSQLKMYLHDSRGDLCKCWDSVCSMLRLQHSELKMSFEHSLSRVKVEHMKNIYNNIKGLVSANAIDYIAKELQQCGLMYVKPSLCGCTIRTTHELTLFGVFLEVLDSYFIQY